jgi:hypothetical protein
MIRAIDYDCIGQPTCTDGYSNMHTLAVPKPPETYRGSVEVLHYVHIVSLTLRITPLGEKLPYKVCWRLKTKKLRCVSGTVYGYSWNSSARVRSAFGSETWRNGQRSFGTSEVARWQREPQTPFAAKGCQTLGSS